MSDDFWEKRTEASEVKTLIVSKYFDSWAKIISRIRDIDILAYVDLFAGPGHYKDGSPSTPYYIFKKAISDQETNMKVFLIFNEKNSEYLDELQNYLRSLPEWNKFKGEIFFTNFQTEKEFLDIYNNLQDIPKLSFIDPWGYKNVTLNLILKSIDDWGSDCILFFNYNRINMGIHNPFVYRHMIKLFGSEGTRNLANNLKGLNKYDRELLIIETFMETIKSHGKNILVVPFKFVIKNKVSHYLFFLTKHPLAFKIMKDIMSKESSDNNQGVGSFEYTDAPKQYSLLHIFSSPLDELGEILLKEYSGKTLSFEKLFYDHQVKTMFTEKNYKDILIKLEEEGKIICDPPANKRKKRKGKVTFSNNVTITFP